MSKAQTLQNRISKQSKTGTCQWSFIPNLPITSEVPQITLVYINDLPECVTSAAHLYVDDCLLCWIISSTTDTMTLQQDLNNLQKWEDDWMMAFNPDKCVVIHVIKK